MNPTGGSRPGWLHAVYAKATAPATRVILTWKQRCGASLSSRHRMATRETRVTPGFSEWNYFLRMHDYLREMFPMPRHLVLSALAAVGIAGFARTTHPIQASLAPGTALMVAWNVFASLLILRLMDELKDKDIDRKLFPERPLPSGRVLESDIRRSLVLAIALYVLANLSSPTVFVSALLVLGYALLMFRRFFAPELLKRSLPITLATHTPIVPLMLAHGFIVATVRHGIPLHDLEWLPILLYVAMDWLAILGWELSRKIRSSEEENDYVTYSQILGRAGAVSIAAGVQTTALLIGVVLYFQHKPGIPYLLFIGGGWVAMCWAYMRFLVHRSASPSRLKLFAAVYIFAVLVAQVYGFVLMRP